MFSMHCCTLFQRLFLAANYKDKSTLNKHIKLIFLLKTYNFLVAYTYTHLVFTTFTSMDINQEVINACSVLAKGGTILYPTDSIWGLGCDASNQAAVNKIIQIKKRSLEKSMLILIDKAEKIENYVNNIPVIAWDLMNKTSRPTTFIYYDVKNLPKNLIASDGSIGIRVTKSDFCQRLIRLLGNPIVSTSANLSGFATALAFNDIQKEVIHQVDYVVDPHIAVVTDSKPSTIIRFTDDYSFEILRD